MTIEQSLNTRAPSNGLRVHQHYMMNYLKLFDAKVSINHWQLRNCISGDTVNRGGVYYIFDHSIRYLDTRTLADNAGLRKRRYSTSINNVLSSTDYHAATKSVVEFPFKPRSFNEKNGLIVCGGHIGNDDNGYIPSRPISSYDHGFSSLDERSFDVECIEIGNSSILSDQTTYSNTRSWKGIVSLYNTTTNVSITCKLGQYINNCVELYETSKNQFDLFTCNNDGHLYQCEINNRDLVLKRRFADLKFALNNAAISHDGKVMCVTGDSNKIALYRKNQLSDVFSLNYDTLSGAFNDQTGSSTEFKHKRIPRYALPDRSSYVDHDHIYELKGADNGFFTSFSENDMMMATVFQNGNCYVYDVRNMDQPITEIHTTRSQGSVPQSGAFRICKFSEGMEDLLFISEHQQRVHVVDTRNFMNRQVIIVPYKYKNMDNYRSGDPNPPSYDSRNWHVHSSNDPLLRSNERRRNSEPAFPDNPFVTMASRIPIQQLQPTILPYSSVSDSHSGADDDDDCGDNDGIGDYDTAIQEDIEEGRGLHTTFNEEEQETQIRRRSDASFTVRRYSTSNRYLPNVTEESAPAVDSPSSSSGHINDSSSERASSNYTLPMPIHSYEDEVTSSIPAIRSFGQTPTRPLMRRPRVYNSSQNIHDLNNEREECNISGIEWLHDQEGSSLIIGTDYGIIKWNINYWARRSFPSYDFC